MIDRCSIEKEYILSAGLKFSNEAQQLNALPHAKKEFPRLGKVPSQVLQQAIKQLHTTAQSLGGISIPWIWISALQEIRAIQIAVVSVIQRESHHWTSLEIAENRADSD